MTAHNTPTGSEIFAAQKRHGHGAPPETAKELIAPRCAVSPVPRKRKGTGSAIRQFPSNLPRRFRFARVTQKRAEADAALQSGRNDRGGLRWPRVPQQSRRGYTLIEIMIVMAIIGILVSIAVPIYQKSLIRAKESVLKNNLFTLRTVIDEYTYDKQKAPQQLTDLVNEGYLRTVPMDPMTGNADAWQIVMEDALTSVNQTEPGIFDVRSGSDGKSLDGTAYSEW